jgi:uncharacterized protein DUF929
MANTKRGPKQHGARPKPRPQPQKSGGLPPWLPGAVVLGLVAAVVVIFIATRPGPPPPPPPHVDYAAQLSAIKPSELDTVGKGSANSSRFRRLAEAPLTAGGKPEVLYIGAEYCPYCAAERWALIVALSRFGTFSGLQPITSAEASIPTFTFHGSSYRSSLVSFKPIEQLDQKQRDLDKTTAAELALEQKYSTGYPFVDFGNRISFDGATYDPSALQGLDWQQIVSELKTPSTATAQGILGSANVLTAAICGLTNQQPGGVCSDPVVQGLEKQLPGG